MPKKSASQHALPPADLRHRARCAWLALLLVVAREHLRRQGIASGFDFLSEPARFGIGESLLPFEPGDLYWRAFAAGLVNTLRADAGIFVLLESPPRCWAPGRIRPVACLRPSC